MQSTLNTIQLVSHHKGSFNHHHHPHIVSQAKPYKQDNPQTQQPMQGGANGLLLYHKRTEECHLGQKPQQKNTWTISEEAGVS